MVGPDNPLYNNHGAHYQALPELVLNFKYDYRGGMRTVNFFSGPNPEGTTYATAVHNIHGKKLLKDG